MKRLVPAILIAFSAMTVSAQVPPLPPEKAAKIGGFLKRPDLARGKVVFVNSQSLVSESEMSDAVTELSRTVRAKIEITKAEDVSLKNIVSVLKGLENASVGIFLVENNDYPTTIMIAPEGKWAIVNVSALNADKPARPFLIARTKKEMVRAFLMLCGGYESTFANSLMGNINSVQELDKITDYRPPMDVVGRARKFLPKVGVDTRPMVTYAQAVKEGWAPAPTNEYQQAIWNKVRAVPKKPMKIEFDPKKGR